MILHNRWRNLPAPDEEGAGETGEIEDGEIEDGGAKRVCGEMEAYWKAVEEDCEGTQRFGHFEQQVDQSK
eukprot:MONOS_16691.1-p1 / transcript=MONOS_16691.1 / gene=MONOS_16691 / organism=Monocercomonoides_exilis_PA203 / gene_product=unspecified product / transcript_product=unspecified product / location=Mono_scaffold02020:2196-2463(+) / protein_length=70 / sequence_SO=supercontig / SO=protein_coding / is_pseudo=false